MAGGLFTLTQRSDGFGVGGAEWNAAFEEVRANIAAAKVEGYSQDVPTMQATTAPGDLGSESLATSVAEEFRRLRFQVLGLLKALNPAATVWYQPVSVGLSAGATLGACRLAYTDASTITLQRSGGLYVMIAGQYYAIPAGGVALAKTGLVANTTYFVYVYMATGSVMTLEASATGHTTDAVTNQEIKLADGSRTLVGMVRMDASGNFAWSPAQRLVASWFNRQMIAAERVDGTARSVSSSASTLVERGTNASRAEFLVWGGATAKYLVYAGVSSGASTVSPELAVGLDATPVVGAFGSNARTIGAADVSLELQAMQEAYGTPAEGYHFACQMYANNSATPVSFVGVRNRTLVEVFI